MTTKQLRQDLKEVKHYYTNRELIDSAYKGKVNPIFEQAREKVRRYDGAISLAPIRLQAVYVSLYQSNKTQEALAAELNYSPRYVAYLTDLIVKHLQKELSKEGK